MSDDNKEGAGVPVAWEVRNAEISFRAVFGTEREARLVADEHDESGYSQAAVRALYATPPAVMPAAPSDAADCQYAKDVGMWPEHRCAAKCQYSNALDVTDGQIDALDKTFALHVMAPRGRASVREFARAVLALSQTMQPQAERSFAVTLGEESIRSFAAPGAAIAAREQEDKS